MSVGALLESGRFLGRSLRTHHQGDLKLADVRYTAGASRHAHERPYFCLIRRGSYTERYGRRTRGCRPNTLVYHPSGEHHAVTLDTAVVLSLNVELGPQWLSWMRDGGFPSDQPGECHGGPAAQLAFGLFRLLHARHRDPLLIESMTADIVATLGRPPRETHPRMPAWLREVPDLLDGAPERIPSLRSLAVQAGVHPVHFAAAFRRHYGCSLGEFARRRRLDHARRQLADPQLTLAQVAAMTGFADQSHLTRSFKRHTGRTPGQYRTFLAFKTPGKRPPTLQA